MSKKDSFSNNLEQVDPAVFILQETKMLKKGNFSKIKGCENYQVFELVRTEGHGGGLAIGIKEDLKPCLVSEGDDDIELLTVQAKLRNHQINFITGYGPQESEPREKRLEFFARLNEEVHIAELAGSSVFIGHI